MMTKRLWFPLCKYLGRIFKVFCDGFQRVYAVKSKINHNETIVPVIPLRFHSSAIRFSASRFICIERFQRAKACSYLIFLSLFSSIINPV